MRRASFHCAQFESVPVKNLLRASNFRVPNDRRYGIDMQALEARVTWTSNDRKELSASKRCAIAQKGASNTDEKPENAEANTKRSRGTRLALRERGDRRDVTRRAHGGTRAEDQTTPQGR